MCGATGHLHSKGARNSAAWNMAYGLLGDTVSLPATGLSVSSKERRKEGAELHYMQMESRQNGRGRALESLVSSSCPLNITTHQG